MRIGIDATALPPQPVGAANYIVNLTQALLSVDPTNDYVIFVKPLHAALFAEQGRSQAIRVPLATRILRIAWEQAALPWLAQQHKLDVLHSPHYTMPFAARCATVVTFHDLTFFLYPEMHLLYKRLFFRAMIPWSARRANALIAISQSTRADILRQLKPILEKVFTVLYGIAPCFHPVENSQALEICRRYNLSKPFILYVGNLEPRKNLPILVRAFAQVVQGGLPHSLVLAGSRGWKDTEVFSTIQALDLTSRVCFPGYVPQQELPALYSAADLFVYPSLYEGFGLPVLEAMACGVPVITSSVSSMPEITGDAGILVNPRDVDGLAEQMRRILTDRARRDRLAYAGMERAKSFSWERAARETLSVYQYAIQSQ
jgi:glycosyltransferase involved in cell wall biosynthesis